MKFESIWKPSNTATRKSNVVIGKDSLGNISSAVFNFIANELYWTYPKPAHVEPLVVEFCEIPKDNTIFAGFISETFVANGYFLGKSWENKDVFKSLQTKEYLDIESLRLEVLNKLAYSILNIGAILSIKTITTVSIQGNLFTNISESIEFVGDLTEEQKIILKDMV